MMGSTRVLFCLISFVGLAVANSSKLMALCLWVTIVLVGGPLVVGPEILEKKTDSKV